jgi:hypothetical protein
VSLAAGLASLIFAVAAALAVAAARGARPSLLTAARTLAAAGGLTLAPFAPEPGARVVLAMAAVAAALPSSGLPMLLAAAAAFGLFLSPSALRGAALGPTLAAGAAGLVACALGRRAAAVASGRDRDWLLSAAGAGLALTLAAAGGGVVLEWRFVAGSPGSGGAGAAAGVLLGLGLLAALAGSLALAAHRASAGGAASDAHPVHRAGQRALEAAGGATALGLVLGLAALDSADPLELARGAGAIQALVLALGALSWAIAIGTGRHPDDGRESQAWNRPAILASFVALAAMLAGGVEAWAATGSYVAPRALALCSAAVLTVVAGEDRTTALPLGVAALVALLWACG